MCYVLAGDLPGDWADFGGLVAQLNLIAIVSDISITGRPCIAIADDRRGHRHVQKLAHRRAGAADCLTILCALHPDITAGVFRDFEYSSGLLKKDK